MEVCVNKEVEKSGAPKGEALKRKRTRTTMVTAMAISATALPASQMVAVGNRNDIFVTSLMISNQIPLMQAQIPCEPMECGTTGYVETLVRMSTSNHRME